MRIIKAYKWTKNDSVAFSIFAAELCIDNFEKVLPNDKRPREAIEAAKRYLENPTEEKRISNRQRCTDFNSPCAPSCCPISPSAPFRVCGRMRRSGSPGRTAFGLGTAVALPCCLREGSRERGARLSPRARSKRPATSEHALFAPASSGSYAATEKRSDIHGHARLQPVVRALRWRTAPIPAAVRSPAALRASSRCTGISRPQNHPVSARRQFAAIAQPC